MELQFEQHVQLPGPFVVLQGMHGDGLLNTLDSAPNFESTTTTTTTQSPTSASGEPITTTATTEQAIQIWESDCVEKANQNCTEWLQTAQQAALMDQTKNHDNIPILSSLSSSGNNDNDTNHRFWLSNARLRVFASLPSCDNPTEELILAGEEGGDCSHENRGGESAISPLPQQHPQQHPIQTVMPGSDLTGVSLHTFEAKKKSCGSSTSLAWKYQGECNQCDSSTSLPEMHHPKAGRLQFLKITASPPLNCQGYVLFGVDGYPVLAPGQANGMWFTGQPGENDNHSMYRQFYNNNTDGWWWKVVHAAGAVVRHNKELRSPVVATLPYGTCVQVRKKALNQCNLPRLWVRAQQVGGNVVEGWCSEVLNPLSGQRGPILQPLPLAVPVLGQVVYGQGAVVRSRIELSSPVVATLPYQRAEPIIGRSFTEFPAVNSSSSSNNNKEEVCVPRLRLAPSAYVSLRLANNSNDNSNDNHRQEVVRILPGQVDASFDPRQPGWYHWRAFQKWNTTSPSPDGTPPQTLQVSIDSPSSTTATTTPLSSSSSSSKRRCSEANRPRVDCVVCLTNEADATVIHGETGHICCCLSCARVCQAQGLGCPLCRNPIERIILHFYS